MLPCELEVLTRSDALRSDVRRALEAHGSAFRDVAIDYVRFKPGTSCVLGFRDADAPVPLGYVKVFLADDPGVCLRKYQARAAADGWVEALPDFRAVLFRFPLDRAVDGLRSVADIAELKHVVHDTVSGLSPDEERVRARRSRTTVLRYKPERRCVVRADLVTKTRDGRPGSRRLVAQAYGDDSGERVHAVMSLLWSRAGRGADALRTARPLGYHGGRRVLLQAWVEGEPWGDGLNAPDAVAACRDSAVALRALHAVDPGSLPSLASFPRMLAETRRVLLDLARVSAAALAETALGLGAELDRSGRGVSPGDRRVVHGDFHPHQLLVGRDGPTLVDWDEAGAGDPRVDVGNLLAHLHLAELEGRVPAERAAHLRNAFCRAYCAGGKIDAGLGFFVALHLAKLAMAPFRALAGDWETTSLAILERARHALAAPVEVAA